MDKNTWKKLNFINYCIKIKPHPGLYSIMFSFPNSPYGNGGDQLMEFCLHLTNFYAFRVQICLNSCSKNLNTLEIYFITFPLITPRMTLILWMNVLAFEVEDLDQRCPAPVCLIRYDLYSLIRLNQVILHDVKSVINLQHALLCD